MFNRIGLITILGYTVSATKKFVGWAKRSVPIKVKAYRWAKGESPYPSYLKILSGLVNISFPKAELKYLTEQG